MGLRSQDKTCLSTCLSLHIELGSLLLQCLCFFLLVHTYVMFENHIALTDTFPHSLDHTVKQTAGVRLGVGRGRGKGLIQETPGLWQSQSRPQVLLRWSSFMSLVWMSEAPPKLMLKPPNTGLVTGGDTGVMTVLQRYLPGHFSLFNIYFRSCMSVCQCVRGCPYRAQKGVWDPWSWR